MEWPFTDVNFYWAYYFFTVTVKNFGFYPNDRRPPNLTWIGYRATILFRIKIFWVRKSAKKSNCLSCHSFNTFWLWPSRVARFRDCRLTDVEELFWKNTKIATRLSVSYAGRESQNSVVYRSRSLSSSARRSYIMARCRASLTLDTARNACVVNIVSSLQLAVTFRHYITCTYWAQNIIVLPRRLLSLVYTRYRYFDRHAIMLL